MADENTNVESKLKTINIKKVSFLDDADLDKVSNEIEESNLKILKIDSLKILNSSYDDNTLVVPGTGGGSGEGGVNAEYVDKEIEKLNSKLSQQLENHISGLLVHPDTINIRKPFTNYALHEIVFIPRNSNYYLECIQVGTTNQDEILSRVFSSGQEFMDGTVKWRVHDIRFAQKYESPVTVNLKGDVAGSFTFSGTEGTIDCTVNVLNANIGVNKATVATRLETPRTISLLGQATGSCTFDGSANTSINVTNVKANQLVNPITISLAGDAVGSATSNLASNISLSVGNVIATKLKTPRTISLSGKATGSCNFDGSGNVTLNVTSVTADNIPTFSVNTTILLSGKATGSGVFYMNSPTTVTIDNIQAAKMDHSVKFSLIGEVEGDGTTDLSASNFKINVTNVNSLGGYSLEEIHEMKVVSEVYELEDIVFSPYLDTTEYLQCTRAGTTAATDPLETIGTNYDVGSIINDGTAQWKVYDLRDAQTVNGYAVWGSKSKIVFPNGASIEIT